MKTIISSNLIQLYKQLIFVLILIFCPVSYSFIGIDFIELFGLSQKNMPRIEIPSSNGNDKTTIYTNIQPLVEKIAENAILNTFKVNTNYFDDDKKIPVYICQKDCHNCLLNFDSEENCKKVLLTALSGIERDGQTFYLSTRHAFINHDSNNSLIFGLNFKIENHSVFQIEQELNNSIEFEDILIFVPNSFLNTCSNSDQNISSCYKKIRNFISKSTYKISNEEKLFWIGVQPSPLMFSQNHDPELKENYQYSAGLATIINNTNFHEGEKVNNNYLSLTKNVSNHTDRGSSGTLIHQLKFINKNDSNDNYQIGAPMGLILCNKIKNQEESTVALNLNHLFNNDKWILSKTSLEKLASELEQRLPFIYINSDDGETCIPVDGRDAGGY